MKYQYRTIPFSAVIQVSKNHEEVSQVYERVLNQGARDGWELFMIDTIQTHKPSGCFSQPENASIKIAIFRKEIE